MSASDNTIIQNNIDITLDQIKAANAVVIPLYLIPFSGGYKVGIRICVANDFVPTPNSTGLKWHYYEFDTGGKGFFVSKSSVAIASNNPLETFGGSLTQYRSGITYVGKAAKLHALFETLKENGGKLTKGPNIQRSFCAGMVDYLYELDNNKEKSANFPIFKQKIKEGVYFGFEGDFGASLQQTEVANPPESKFQHPLPNSAPKPEPELVTLWSVLPRVETAKDDSPQGYIIDLANLTDIDKPIDLGLPEGTKQGRLIIGDASYWKDQFPTVSPLNAIDPAFGYNDPAKSSQNPYPTFAEAQQVGSLRVGDDQPLAGIPIVMDTGAPHTTIYQPKNNEKIAKPLDTPYDVELIAQPPGGKGEGVQLLKYTVTAQDNKPGVNQTDWGNSPDGQGAYINTGITPFLNFPILFDLKEGVMRFPGAKKE